MRHQLAGALRLTLFALALLFSFNSVTQSVDTNTSPVDRPSAAPTWDAEYRERFPGCTNKKRLADIVVVVRMSARVQLMGFNEAWERGTNENRADDVWVVGWCD